MQYAAMTFWLLVIVFTALGVHRLWSSLIQPKVVNSLLLPGTLVAQLGYILGLLITGGTVNNTALIKDDDTGEPQTGQDPKPRVPIVGMVIIALLPMVGCAIAIYWVSRYFGSEILAGMETTPIDRSSLPSSVSMFFLMIRASVDLVEQLINVIRASNLTNWRTALFLYLVICLTVRMAPLTGNVRGSLGAILLTGILAFLVGQVTQSTADPLAAAWPLITFCAAVLLFLLMFSLVFRGAVDLVKTLIGHR